MGQPDLENRPLTVQQRAVLQWVADGCAEGVYEGYAHRAVATALTRRGFLETSGHGASWASTITPKGLERLAAKDTVSANEAAATALWARLLASGGALTIDTASESGEWNKIFWAAERSPARPEGKTLKRQQAYGSRFSIAVVVNYAELVEVKPVPIPTRLKPSHQVVAKFLNDKDWQYVSADLVKRAALILQALADEAPLRGLSVKDTNARIGVEERSLWRAHMVIAGPEHGYRIRISEVSAPHAPRRRRYYGNKPARMPEWIAQRDSEFVPTGQLELRVFGQGTHVNATPYRDSRSRSVEEKLPQVFQSFEIYAMQREQQRQEWVKDSAAREVLRAAEMEKAQALYRTVTLRQVAREQADRWRQATELDAFATEIERRAQALEPDPKANALVWAAEVRSAARGVDPLDGPIGIPTIKDPTEAELRPYLGRWSY